MTAQAVFRNETHSRDQVYVIKEVERTWRYTSLFSGRQVWWRDRGICLDRGRIFNLFLFYFFFLHCLVLFPVSTAIWSSSFSLAFLDGLPALWKGMW